MADDLYPTPSRELIQARQALATETNDAFAAFSKSAFKTGVLDAKSKQLIAVAVAHVTQCPYCIRGHTKQALRAGATREEVMEAIWVAAEMRAGAVVAHSNLALDAMNEVGG
jgi:AhpD family alkylhydroperoxidase